VPVYKPELCRELNKSSYRQIYSATLENEFRKHGTANLCMAAEAFGDMPIKNLKGDAWPKGAAEIGAPNYLTV
jgi:aldehyde:ferredoxin oxidoreductase